uniref:XPG_I_2 domain-containing protein n=1 Tax=Macrostomum lignano TaxID=282301 RepID=A0A1I8FVM2_9PLAT
SPPPAASSCWKNWPARSRAIACCRFSPYDVFGQAAVDRGFPVATVLTGDADEQSATLAGRLGCPLLTGDSDFFLYPLPGGVIPSTAWTFRTRHCPSGRELHALLHLSAVDSLDSPVRTAEEECLAELRRRLQPELMSRFDASLRHYQLKPEHEALRLGADSAKIEFPEAAPAPLTDSHRRRRKLVFFIDALLYQRVILPIGIEHPNLPGLFESTRALRSIAYSLENFRTTVIEYVRSGTEVLQVPVKLSTRRHRCPSADSWRCALEHIDASEDADKQLTALLPEKLAGGSQRLRLALHLLRLSLNGGDRRSRCVTRALLALCLLRHDASKDSDNDDDKEDEGPPKKTRRFDRGFRLLRQPAHRRGSGLLSSALEVRLSGAAASVQRFPGSHCLADALPAGALQCREDDRLLDWLRGCWLAASSIGWPPTCWTAGWTGTAAWPAWPTASELGEPPARACSGWPTGSPLLGCRPLLLLTEAAES